MSIQTAMDDALAAGSNLNDAVDKFYENLQQPNFDWGDPNVQEFDYVMTTFAQWVKNEKKKVDQGPTSPLARSQVITYIQDYCKSKATAAFVDIHPAIFGIQLAMRVRRPRSFDQGSTGLCGAVAVLYNFAKLQPTQFAQFALHLFFEGHAMFGDFEITPTEKVKHYYRLRKNKIPWAVDYVTLVSLRQCTFLSDKIGIDAVRGADETTLPGQLGAWMSQAGYKNVEDHTFFSKSQHKLVKTFAAKINQPVHVEGADGDAQARLDRKGYAFQNLQSAKDALRNGRVVIIFSDGELGEILRGDAFKKRTGPTSLGSHHWMAVRSIDIYGDTDVKLKVITWRNSYKKLMKIADFIPRYNGFISAEP